MKNLHEVLHGIQCKMFHGLPDYAWSLPQRVGPTPNLGPQHFKISEYLIHYDLLCTRAHTIEDGNEMISVENPATYISTLNLKVKLHLYFWMGINWTDLPSFMIYTQSFLMVQSVVYRLHFCSGSLELVCSWTDHRFPEWMYICSLAQDMTNLSSLLMWATMV
jgi:hypothetical protein